MTPRTIAYAVVQVSEPCVLIHISLNLSAWQARFAIAESSEWTQIENEFDYEQFYWNIVELCESDEDSETVKFFN